MMITDNDMMIQALEDAKKLIKRRKGQCVLTVGQHDTVDSALKALDDCIKGLEVGV